jgi:hypothetical protein
MTVFWVVAPCTLVEIYWRFRGVCCLHHQSDVIASTSEKSVTFFQNTRCSNPEYSHLQQLCFLNSNRHGKCRFIMHSITLINIQRDLVAAISFRNPLFLESSVNTASHLPTEANVNTPQVRYPTSCSIQLRRQSRGRAQLGGKIARGHPALRTETLEAPSSPPKNNYSHHTQRGMRHCVSTPLMRTSDALFSFPRFKHGDHCDTSENPGLPTV